MPTGTFGGCWLGLMWESTCRDSHCVMKGRPPPSRRACAVSTMQMSSGTLKHSSLQRPHAGLCLRMSRVLGRVPLMPVDQGGD